MNSVVVGRHAAPGAESNRGPYPGQSGAYHPHSDGVGNTVPTGTPGNSTDSSRGDQEPTFLAQDRRSWVNSQVGIRRKTLFTPDTPFPGALGAPTIWSGPSLRHPFKRW
jgi:hypothetical protein